MKKLSFLKTNEFENPHCFFRKFVKKIGLSCSKKRSVLTEPMNFLKVLTTTIFFIERMIFLYKLLKNNSFFS